MPSEPHRAAPCLSLCIPYSAGVGHAHGYWGAYLKHAGHEGIFVNREAARPAYLWIDDNRVELRDASHLWGLDTRETERRLKLALGDQGDISVACIGPAGEAELPGAMVKADRNHGAGKASPGAITGSKQLKAIAVRGTDEAVPLFDPEGLVDTFAEWEGNLFLDKPEVDREAYPRRRHFRTWASPGTCIQTSSRECGPWART